jgi:tRNA 2-thiouridine synthesizing protein C
MTTRRILFVIAHPPQRGALPRELLDALLVGAVFDQNISVLFVADGVYQLVDTAQTQGNIARGFSALPTYDVDAVYVDGAAMRRRGLSAAGFTLPARSLTRGGIRELLAAQDVVIGD